MNVIVWFFIGSFLFGTCYQDCGRFVEQETMPLESLESASVSRAGLSLIVASHPLQRRRAETVFASDLNRRGQREARRKSSRARGRARQRRDMRALPGGAIGFESCY